MADVSDWVDLGPPCMNCGERVPPPDSEIIVNSEDPDKITGIIFKGMCRSEICRKLPPGGNPFMYMVN